MSAAPIEESVLQTLVARAQGGDTDAFGQIYDCFFQQVYRYSAFRVPEAMAEDLTADIFVKAWEKLHTYKERKGVPFAAWLFRIARHAVIDAYRRQQATMEEVPDDIEDDDVLNRAEARVKRNHLLKTMRGALDRLPGRYKEVLELSFVADLPHSEVARVLRMREGAVRILKFRALRKLETLLPADIQEEIL